MNRRLILIVEDDEILAETLVAVIGDVYRCEVAHSLEDAKKRVQHSPLPDCIVLDLLLPNGAGMELVNDLDRHTPSTPIVVMSGFDVSEKACLVAGAQALLKKPVQPDVLIEAIEKTVKEWTTRGSLSKLERSMALLEKELGGALDKVRSKTVGAT